MRIVGYRARTTRPIAAIAIALAAMFGGAVTARCQETIRLPNVTVTTEPRDDGTVTLQVAGEGKAAAIVLQGDAIGDWWPAAKAKLTAAVQAGKNATVPLNGQRLETQLELEIRRRAGLASGVIAVHRSSTDSVTFPIGALAVLRVIDAIGDAGQAATRFTARNSDSAGAADSDCSGAKDTRRREWGQPDNVQRYDEGTYHSETWWYWSRGVSKSYTWDDREGTCSIGTYTFEPRQPPP